MNIKINELSFNEKEIEALFPVSQDTTRKEAWVFISGDIFDKDEQGKACYPEAQFLDAKILASLFKEKGYKAAIFFCEITLHYMVFRSLD